VNGVNIRFGASSSQRRSRRILLVRHPDRGELGRGGPHSAKLKILSAYLQAWFPIVGQSHSFDRVIYIDGFAGPGRYKQAKTAHRLSR
jgi:hypothetical protein